MSQIPTGVVTFLFTDIEGSTRLWAADAAGMNDSLRVHDELIRDTVEEHGGYVFTTAGDAFCVAFERPGDAIVAAERTRDALTARAWPGPRLAVRIGVHRGEADERNGDYFGPPVNTAARVADAGHGGQIVITDAVRTVVELDATDLGIHVLRDLPDPLHLWQVGSDEFPPLRTPTVRTNLPIPPTRLIGRDDEVREVRLLLTAHRLVTLVAVGGSGKTRLAIAAADAEVPHWRDGVWFVDLTHANDADDVAPAIARSIGLELRSDRPDEEVVAYVAGRELLLVLDNCEHVVEICADVVSRVLAAGGRSAVLATSREWLDIPGEHTYQVPSLATDGRGSPAVALFAERATDVAPDFDVVPHVADVSELCRRLDGIPLAIELAASRVAVMAPADLLAGLRDRFRLLSGGRRRHRHRTLEATIDWSHDQLDAEEQRVMRALGVFVGSFDVPAVAAVCDLPEPDAADLLEALYVRSLVATSRDGHGRFRLLETLKAYAEDRLVDAGEAAEVQARHRTYFVRLGASDDLMTARTIERSARLLPDIANLTLCADLLEDDREWEDLARLLFGIAFVNGDDAAAMTARLDRCRRQLDGHVLADLLTQAEVFCASALADWRAYIGAAGRLRESTDPLMAAYGYLYLAMVTGRDDPGSARSLIDRFVEVAGDRAPEVVADEATLWRAMVAAMEGDFDTARPLAEAVASGPIGRTSMGLNASVTVGFAGWTHGNAAPLEQVIGRIDSVHRHARRMDPYYAWVREYALALTTLDARDLDAAADGVRAAAVDAASGRVAMASGDTLILLAELARLEGDIDRARELGRSTGPGRSPPTVGLLRVVGRRLGIDDELQDAYRQRMGDEEWMVGVPDRALQDELRRRGWIDDRAAANRS